MASLEKRNGIWRIGLYHAGRRLRRSLKTGDRRAAQAHLAVLEDTLHRVKLGSLKIPDGADVLSFLLSGGQATHQPTNCKRSIETVGQLLDRTLKDIPSGSLEETTVNGMVVHLRHLKRILGRSTPLSQVGSSKLQEYINRRSRQKGIRGRKVQPATVEKELTTLRGGWNRAHRAGAVPQRFPQTKDLRYPKSVEKPPFQTRKEIEARIARGNLSEAAQQDLWDCLYLTPPEIDEVLEHVQKVEGHPFVRPMFEFAAHTGARRSEILRSRYEDVDFETGQVIIREKKRVRGKLTTRSVPLSPRLRTVLKEWFATHPGGAYTFCRRHSDDRAKVSGALVKQITPGSARFHFKKTLCNSKWKIMRGWHVFRHSFCSIAAAKGIDQRTINGWVGHQTEEMVQRYRHLIPSYQQEDIRKMFGEE